MASSSSSTSFIEKSYQYDVFLSFSGEDTRKTFVDHLYEALKRHGIHTYKDDERLKQGKSVSDQLLKSIEDSKLYIIIFSKKYASSSWCLNELVKIMECQGSNKRSAFPVFYDVEPSEVRKQCGPVGEALAKHNNKDIMKWKDALTEAANLSGWDLRRTANGHEAKVIKLIVDSISLDLRNSNVNLDDKLVGMESRLQVFQEYLDITSNEVRMIGIWGMGGAGKTTLARAVFDKISVNFEAKSFVENVREVSNASLSGLLSLQQKILSDVLDGQGNNVSSVHDGTNMMKTKLRGRKVLVVLDDVDHKDQLETLAGDLSWFKPGSRIIITTRDEQVLTAHRVKWIRDVTLLSDEEAIGLFCKHAFGKDLPIQEYEKESLQVVQYAASLPLTIKVLGSFLCGKIKDEWTDTLTRLKTIPLKETLEKLELSYTSLEDDYKEIFLDVACLLKGWEKNKAIKMLESRGFQARIGLRVLEQRSLITYNGVCLSMHDHIEEMGQNIVRRKHPTNEHSRMWKQEEIEEVLGNDSGTEAIRCISLKFNRDIVLKGLIKMRKLECLIIDDRGRYEFGANEDHRYFEDNDEDCEYFPNSLRYLWFYRYPRWCLPKSFLANNLVTLNLEHSNIKQLWAAGKVMKKLKFINLSFSKVRTLDLGLTPNLVRLDLVFVKDLVEIRVPRGSLKGLVHLDLSDCKRLKSFSFIKELESLEVLLLNDLHLKEFPDIIPSHSKSSLQELHFRNSVIEYLPSSIGNLHKLVYLDLERCRKLKGLPERICSLQHLRVLSLSYSGIEELPDDIGQLERLERLYLSDTQVKHLPDSICKLKHLKDLDLSKCNELEKLPDNLGDLECLEELVLGNELEILPNNLWELEYLEHLHLTGGKIREIPSSICKLKHLRVLNLRASKVQKLPENLGDLECLKTLDLAGIKIRDIPSSICKLRHLKDLNLSECYELEKLPENLGDLECLEELNLEGSKIREIPSSICKLRHLKDLNLSKCYELEKLPENLGDLECLEELRLERSKIREIPCGICKLKHLKSLKLIECYELEKLPENLGDLECLEELRLEGSKIREIPSSICKLRHLKDLNLSKCYELEKLPENLGDLECLEYLILVGSKIREIPSSICKLRHLKSLILSQCYELEKLPENLGDLECLERLHLKDTPISHLPHSISLLKDLEIVGYEKRMDPDALLSQEQHTTCARKRKRTDIEATTSGDVMNESQPLDLKVQPVDQASQTSHTSVNEFHFRL